MNTKRSYDDACGSAHALDLIGERWALLVVRELILGPKRFTDLRKGLPDISPNVLTQRLSELEATHIVRRRKLPPPANVWIYELTDWGMELENILMILGQWAVRSPILPKTAAISIDSLMLSFRAMFNASAAKGLNARYGIVTGGDSFQVIVSESEITVSRGVPDHPDVMIEADHTMLAAVVYGGYPLKEALKSNTLQYTGDKSKFERFLTLFPLPPPISLT